MICNWGIGDEGERGGGRESSGGAGDSQVLAALAEATESEQRMNEALERAERAEARAEALEQRLQVTMRLRRCRDGSDPRCFNQFY
jgi:hypothetical protein